MVEDVDIGMQGAFSSLFPSDTYRDSDKGEENRGLVLTGLLGIKMSKWLKSGGCP